MTVSGMDYTDYLTRKMNVGADSGFEPTFMPEALFDFQVALTEWAVRKGRAGIFADCGLGKTAMQLVWAENVARHTGKRVLILTPLAVSAQTIQEAEKFGIEASRSREGEMSGRILVTNYERLQHFNPEDFAGVVCDESSILKAFDGTRRHQITDFMRKVPYRLLATATAAPNDYIELGTSSEALGYLGHMDMLGKFFRNEQNNSATRMFYGEAPKWRLKGHAGESFWRYVAFWARACRKPSDLGFDDGRFILPPITETQHVVDSIKKPEGWLFPVTAVTLEEQRDERKRTISERCEQVANMVNPTGAPALVWCHLNEEARALRQLIPDAVEISGSDSEDRKESAFTDFATGNLRVLITKPKIGAWGLNFQNCSHVTFFPSHSFEQYYQAVRRCWRFGQKNPVQVDIVLTESERRVMDNLQRKAGQASEMFNSLVAEMQEASIIHPAASGTSSQELPTWL